MQVDHYEQFNFEKKRLNVHPLHACATAMEITLQCIDEHGMEITLQCIDEHGIYNHSFLCYKLYNHIFFELL